MLKDYDKEEDSQTTAKAEPYNMLLLNNSSVQRYEREKDNNGKASESYKLRFRAIRLRDCLVNDQNTEYKNIGKVDNSAYLAAFLHVFGPEKANKTKHCILNGSLIIGFENEDPNMKEHTYCLSDEITINGPGATCKYQKGIRPSEVLHLSTDMIDKLESAHNTDETSYIEICVTLGQIFFTTITCMDIDGDRWAKVIIIIYSAMSVLQSTSLFILHKQSMSFSIKDGQELSPEAIEAALTEEIPKKVLEYADFIKFADQFITVVSTFLGMIASLLIAIWADYNAHSTTQWLVLSWILSPIVVAVALIFFFNVRWAGDDDISIIVICILCIASAGCLIAATVIEYLPK